MNRRMLLLILAATVLLPGAAMAKIFGTILTTENVIVTTEVGIITNDMLAAPVSPAKGGFGIDVSGSSGVPSVNIGTWTINNVLGANRLLIGAAGNAITSNVNATYDGTSFVIGTTGPHAIGGAANAEFFLTLTGSFPSTANPFGLSFRSFTLNAASGGTAEAALLYFDSSDTIQTAAASFTLLDAVGASFHAPTITLGAGSGVTNATTLKIWNAPSGAVNNYALWVAGGTIKTPLGGGTGVVDVQGVDTCGAGFRCLRVPN